MNFQQYPENEIDALESSERIEISMFDRIVEDLDPQAIYAVVERKSRFEL